MSQFKYFTSSNDKLDPHQKKQIQPNYFPSCSMGLNFKQDASIINSNIIWKIYNT